MTTTINQKNKKRRKYVNSLLVGRIINDDEEIKKEKIKNEKRQKILNAKRKSNDLLKLYEKQVIDQEQYASGERLLQDYESSFKNKCATTTLEEVKVQKTTKMNNEFHLIQNLNSWDRYNKAISSIKDLPTREIVRMFVIEGKGLTCIDKGLKKQGVAEVRLWYGLKELARFYKGLSRKNYLNRK